MKRIIVHALLCVIFFALSGLDSISWYSSPISPAHAQTSPAFEPAICGFYVPAGQRVACGYLTVPEDRAQPASPTIRLHVATFKSLSSTPAPDPVVYLMSGPGGWPGSNESSVLPLNIEVDFGIFLENRDLIVMDQRGTGFSEPKLDCAAANRLPMTAIDQPQPALALIETLTDTLTACQADYVAQGVNLAAYTSAAIAADLHDLRLALGYDQWNLYSVGYGTRIALATMRDHPEGLRSVILDSPVPPQANFIEEQPTTIVQSLQLLFTACAADPDCGVDFPTVANDLYATISALNAAPVTVRATHPTTGQPFDLLLDGERFINTVRWSLYYQDNIQFMPYVISAAAAGSVEFVRLFAEQLVITPGFIPEIMQYAVLCNEEIPFSSRETLATHLDAIRPEARPYLSIEGTVAFNLCDAWNLPAPDPAVKAPVASDIPTLILSGAYDLVSGSTYGDVTAATLSHHHLYKFPDQTYNVLFSVDPCPLLVTLAFINDPTSDSTPECFAQVTGINFISRQDMLNLQSQISSTP